MRRPYGRRVVGILCVAMVGQAACAGSESDSGQPPDVTTETTVAVSTDPAPPQTTTSAPETTTTIAPFEDGPLADVCPERIVIQTAGLPGPDVGPLYQLVPDDWEVDSATGTVSAPLVRPDGTQEDVTLEIRSGGPAVGFLTPLTLLTADPSILLAQSSIAVALRDAGSAPSVGVISLTDRSRDVVIVDPATYPAVDSIEAVRDAGIEVRHITDAPFIAYLAGVGALAPAQLVGGFGGEPAAFVQSGGAIAQQGDGLVEPVLIPSLPQWARPVLAIEAAGAGWDDHDDALVVRPDAVRDERDCLGRLVPIIQRAVAAYTESPQAANVLMATARSSFTPLSRLNAELMDAGVAAGIETGIFGPGSDPTIGNFDVERLDPFLTEFAEILAVEPIATEDLVTNEFVDLDVTSAD